MKQGKRETKGHTEKYTKMPFLGGGKQGFSSRSKDKETKKQQKKQKQKKQKQIK